MRDTPPPTTQVEAVHRTMPSRYEPFILMLRFDLTNSITWGFGFHLMMKLIQLRALSGPTSAFHTLCS